MPTPEVKVVKPDEEKKAKAWKRLRKLLEERREKTKHISVEEAERDAIEMVRRYREKEYAKNKQPS